MVGDKNKLMKAIIEKDENAFLKEVSLFKPVELNFTYDCAKKKQYLLPSYNHVVTPMNAVILWGTSVMLEKLLELGVAPVSSSANDLPALHMACWYGSVKMVKLILSRSIYHIRFRPSNQSTPLEYALIRNDYESEAIIRELFSVDNNLLLFTPETGCCSTFSLACKKYPHLAICILDKIQQWDENITFGLIKSAESSNNFYNEIVNIILSKDRYQVFNHKYSNHIKSQFKIQLSYNLIEILAQIVKNKVEEKLGALQLSTQEAIINECNQIVNSILVLKDHPIVTDLKRKIVNLKAEPGQKNSSSLLFSDQQFLLSILNRDMDKFLQLVEVCPDHKFNNFFSLASLLKESSAPRWHNLIPSTTNFTILGTACVWGLDEMVEILLAKNAFQQTSNPQGRPPLHLACKYGSFSKVKSLLNQGAASATVIINLLDVPGSSPLMAAIESDLADKGKIIDILLENGADAYTLKNPNSDSSLTAFEMACVKSDFLIINKLILHAVKLHAKGDAKFTENDFKYLLLASSRYDEGSPSKINYILFLALVHGGYRYLSQIPLHVKENGFTLLSAAKYLVDDMLEKFKHLDTVKNKIAELQKLLNILSCFSQIKDSVYIKNMTSKVEKDLAENQLCECFEEKEWLKCLDILVKESFKPMLSHTHICKSLVDFLLKEIKENTNKYQNNLSIFQNIILVLSKVEGEEAAINLFVQEVIHLEAQINPDNQKQETDLNKTFTSKDTFFISRINLKTVLEKLKQSCLESLSHANKVEYLTYLINNFNAKEVIEEVLSLNIVKNHFETKNIELIDFLELPVTQFSAKSNLDIENYKELYKRTRTLAIIYSGKALDIICSELASCSYLDSKLADEFLCKQEKNTLKRILFLQPDSAICKGINEANQDFVEFIFEFQNRQGMLNEEEVEQYILLPIYKYERKGSFKFVLLNGNCYQKVVDNKNQFKFEPVFFSSHPLLSVMHESAIGLAQRALDNIKQDTLFEEKQRLQNEALIILEKCPLPNEAVKQLINSVQCSKFAEEFDQYIDQKDYQKAYALLEKINFINEKACYRLLTLLLNEHELAIEKLNVQDDNKLVSLLVSLIENLVTISQSQINDFVCKILKNFYPSNSWPENLIFISRKRIKFLLEELRDTLENKSSKINYLNNLISNMSYTEIIIEIFLLKYIYDKLKIHSINETKNYQYILLDNLAASLPNYNAITLPNSELIDINVENNYVIRADERITYYKFMNSNSDEVVLPIFKKIYPYNFSHITKEAPWVIKYYLQQQDAFKLFYCFYEFGYSNFNLVVSKNSVNFINEYASELQQETLFSTLHLLFLKKSNNDSNQYARRHFLELLIILDKTPTHAAVQKIVQNLEKDKSNKLQHCGPLPSQKIDNPFIETIKTICKLNDNELERLYQKYKKHLNAVMTEKKLYSQDEYELVSFLINGLSQPVNLTKENLFQNIQHAFITSNLHEKYSENIKKYAYLLGQLQTSCTTETIKVALKAIDSRSGYSLMLWNTSDPMRDSIKRLGDITSKQELESQFTEYMDYLRKKQTNETNDIVKFKEKLLKSMGKGLDESLDPTRRIFVRYDKKQSDGSAQSWLNDI